MRRRSPASSPASSEANSPTNTSTQPLLSSIATRDDDDSASISKLKKSSSPHKQQQQPSLLFLLPLFTVSILCGSCVLFDVAYHHFVIPIYQSYERIPIADDYNFHETFRNEFTYYDRHCRADDLTTNDANDLLVTPDMTSEQAAGVMLRHGTIAIRNLLSKETAANLYKYLANKHAEPLHYNEVFWQEMHRLSLALGTKDHPSVAQALWEVGESDTLRTALEGIVGPNPALVEISTLTARSGCNDQGIHTDSDWFGSSLLYGRSFLHSYSMFIALQDTSQALGATTVCPGSHMCADVDLEDVCINHGAFSVSTNGKTGEEEGMLYAGDGFLFNQNIWHRGPANRMQQDRIMFILTFTSSKEAREQKENDFRRQGLGTYYYQRWNMWGHTLNDLKQVTTRMIQPWAGLRALGLLPSSGGIPWIHQFAQQIGSGSDFYDDYELIDMKQSLLADKPQFLFSKAEAWKPFLIETFRIWSMLSATLYAAVCLGTIILCPRSRKRIVQLHIGIFLFFGALYLYMCQTELGQSVRTGHVNVRSTRPYHPDNVSQGTRPTVFPERNDILFGTRLGSDFLHSFRHFLDYHPGNEDFLQRVQEAAAVSSSLDEVAAAENIVGDMLQESEMGMPRRFLLQNHTNGAWELLTVPEAVEQTRRNVRAERDTTTQQTARQLEHTLSLHRFGLHRETEQAQKAAKKTEQMLEEALAKTSTQESSTTRVQEMDYEARTLDFQPNLGDKIWAWDEDNGKWAEAVFQGYQQDPEGYRAAEFELFSDKTLVRRDYYVRPYYRVTSGDRVVVDYDGDSREFFHGTIEFVYPDGYCFVNFDDGEHHHYIPRAHIFKLLPEFENNESGESADE